jgi:probable rRNA maturation factor
MITEKHLYNISKNIFSILEIPNSTLDIFLLKTNDIAKLKARFIKKKTEPNILSFPEPPFFPHPETKKKYLGEIYLNKNILDETPERAAPLLIHGILHLLGYSHHRKKEAEKMESLEKEIFNKLIVQKKFNLL